MKKGLFVGKAALLGVCWLPLLGGNVWAHAQDEGVDGSDSVILHKGMSAEESDKTLEAALQQPRKSVKDHKVELDGLLHKILGEKKIEKGSFEEKFIKTVSHAISGGTKGTIFNMLTAGEHDPALRAAIKRRVEQADSPTACSLNIFSETEKVLSSRNLARMSAIVISSGYDFQSPELSSSIQTLLNLDPAGGEITPLQKRTSDQIYKNLVKFFKASKAFEDSEESKSLPAQPSHMERIVAFTQTLDLEARDRVQGIIKNGLNTDERREFLKILDEGNKKARADNEKEFAPEEIARIKKAVLQQHDQRDVKIYKSILDAFPKKMMRDTIEGAASLTEVELFRKQKYLEVLPLVVSGSKKEDLLHILARGESPAMIAAIAERLHQALNAFFPSDKFVSGEVRAFSSADMGTMLASTIMLPAFEQERLHPAARMLLQLDLRSPNTSDFQKRVYNKTCEMLSLWAGRPGHMGRIMAFIETLDEGVKNSIKERIKEGLSKKTRDEFATLFKESAPLTEHTLDTLAEEIRARKKVNPKRKEAYRKTVEAIVAGENQDAVASVFIKTLGDQRPATKAAVRKMRVNQAFDRVAPSKNLVSGVVKIFSSESIADLLVSTVISRAHPTDPEKGLELEEFKPIVRKLLETDPHGMTALQKRVYDKTLELLVQRFAYESNQALIVNFVGKLEGFFHNNPEKKSDKKTIPARDFVKASILAKLTPENAEKYWDIANSKTPKGA